MSKLKSYLLSVVAMLSIFFVSPAMAFTAPAAGDFGYDAYDIFFNKMVDGPLGWIGAGILVFWGLSKVMQQWMMTLLCMISASAIIKWETLLTSLGAVLQ